MSLHHSLLRFPFRLILIDEFKDESSNLFRYWNPIVMTHILEFDEHIQVYVISPLDLVRDYFPDSLHFSLASIQIE